MKILLIALALCATLSAEIKRAAVKGGEVEYEVSGTGEPVLMIHGTGVAATFAPQMTQPALAGYRLIRFHRRGFAGSSRAPIPFTMKEHAADAKAILDLLGVKKAHIVGHSFGGMVTLQFALDYPEMVQSLTVMEPPIFNAAASPGPFGALDTTYRSGDKAGAMATFSQMSYGTDWRALAGRVPGGPEQVFADVDTVFQAEVPAMVTWRFTQDEAARIKQPVIYLTGGGGHGASLTQFKQWIPGIESAIIPNVTHAMLMQEPKAVAEHIAAFLRRHAF